MRRLERTGEPTSPTCFLARPARSPEVRPPSIRRELALAAAAPQSPANARTRSLLAPVGGAHRTPPRPPPEKARQLPRQALRPPSTALEALQKPTQAQTETRGRL